MTIFDNSISPCSIDLLCANKLINWPNNAGIINVAMFANTRAIVPTSNKYF